LATHVPCFRVELCPWVRFEHHNELASVLRKKINVDVPPVLRRGSGGAKKNKKKKISEKFLG
jgi:hypothetical protein